MSVFKDWLSSSAASSEHAAQPAAPSSVTADSVTEMSVSLLDNGRLSLTLKCNPSGFFRGVEIGMSPEAARDIAGRILEMFKVIEDRQRKASESEPGTPEANESA